MTIDEFYEAFATAAPKFKWQLIKRDAEVLRAFSKDGDDEEICPITANYWNITKTLLKCWAAKEIGRYLNLSDMDVRLIMCAADNELLQGVTSEERDRCRAKLLKITGVSSNVDATSESNASHAHSGS